MASPQSQTRLHRVVGMVDSPGDNEDFIRRISEQDDSLVESTCRWCDITFVVTASQVLQDEATHIARCPKRKPSKRDD